MLAGLSPSLQDEIWFCDKPTNLPDFITLLKKAENKIKYYQSYPTNRRSPIPTSAPAQRPSSASIPAHVACASFALGVLVPMELYAGRRHMSQQEKIASMGEGGCFYCGGIGHMSSVCPAKHRPAGLYLGSPAARLSV